MVPPAISPLAPAGTPKGLEFLVEVVHTGLANRQKSVAVPLLFIQIRLKATGQLQRAGLLVRRTKN